MKSNIKYDLKIYRKIRIAAVVLTVIVLMSIMLICFNLELFRKYEMLFSIGIFAFWPMVGTWLMYIDARIFLSNLEKAGYEVPYDRRAYGEKIENLPRVREVEINNEGTNKSSKRLSVIAGIVCGILLAVDIKYVLQWYCVGDSFAMFIFMAVLIVMWGIGSYVYKRQSDNTKFRDMLEPDDGRKIRTSFARGIFTIVLCGFISAFLVSIPFSMTEYIAKSRILHDKELITGFTNALCSICEENDFENNSPLYSQLVEGFEPFETKWADEELMQLSLEACGYEYLDQIEEQLISKDAKVFIRYKEGRVETEYTFTWEYGKPRTELYY